MRRLVPSVLVLGVLVVAGCTPTSNWSPTASPTPERLAEPLTFDNALETDQDYETRSWAAMQDELGIVLSDEVRTDAYGSWHPLTIAPDAPLLDIDPEAIPDDLGLSWTPERLRETWQVAAEFLVSEWLDSELVWDDTPANRQIVADRIGGGPYSDPYPFINYLDSSTTLFVGDFAYGLYALDQNYGGWRQAGGQPDDLTLVAASPAPYALDRPRTLVSAMSVSEIVQDSPSKITMGVYIDSYRVINVDGVEGSRYERGSIYVNLRMAYRGGAVLIGYEDVWRNFEDHAMVSNETRRRLPFLVSTPVDGWVKKDVAGISVGMPPSAAADSDGSCDYRLPDDQSGEVFRLGVEVTGREGCVRVYSWSPSDSEPQTEVVQTNETIWGAQAPGLLGTVDVRRYATFDTVDFFLTEGPGPSYRVTADVPSGTGEQFARQMLSTLDASAVASPSPTRT